MVPLFSRVLDLKTPTVHMPVVGSAATHSQTCAPRKHKALHNVLAWRSMFKKKRDKISQQALCRVPRSLSERRS